MSLTNDQVQAMVDRYAPSQGEPWDMAAMLRDAFRYGLLQAASIADASGDGEDELSQGAYMAANAIRRAAERPDG